MASCHDRQVSKLSIYEDIHERVAPKEPKVKRPMNAFMLWSKEKRRQISKVDPGLHNAQISKILGEEWKLLSKEEKEPYIEESKKLMTQHKIDHPDYHYKPRQNKFNKCLKEFTPFPVDMSIHENIRIKQYSALHSRLESLQHRARYMPYPKKILSDPYHKPERSFEPYHAHIMDSCQLLSKAPQSIDSQVCSCHPFFTVIPRNLNFSCCRRGDNLISSHRMEDILDYKHEMKPRKTFPCYGISIPSLVIRSDDPKIKRPEEIKPTYKSGEDVPIESKNIVIVDV